MSAFDAGWQELMIVVVICLGGWFVWDSLRVREAANDAMRSACERRRLFFLDDTVALASLSAVRDDDGQMALRRCYRFAYSDTGHNRRRGEITLVGRRVVALMLEADPLENPAPVTGRDSVN